MVKQPIGKLDGRVITFCQCESQEEAAREGLPQGMYSFWEDDGGKRIFSPGTIVMMAQKAAVEGKSISDLISPSAIAKHHKTVYEHQRKILIEYLKMVRTDLKGPHSNEQLKVIDDMIADFEGAAFIVPDPDGAVRMTREQAEKLAGGEDVLQQHYTETQIREHFR
jgi:hypothetical protein